MNIRYAFTLLLPLLCAAGRVETRDGKTLTGAVSFADNAVVVRQAVGETRVPLDQVGRAALSYVEPAKVQAGSPLPAGWKSQDVGGAKFPGSAACDGAGLFTLTASGWGAWGAVDSLHLAYQTLEGDGQIFARVVKLDDAHGPVVAGVMIRESLAPDAPMAAACLHVTGEVHFTRRPADGPLKEFKATDPDPKATAWVRLTRRGEDVVAFRSPDGKFWQRVDQYKVPMGKSVLVGVCAWTTGNAWPGSAQVDSVHVVPGTPGLGYFPGGDRFVQGVLFRDGTRVAATIVSADAKVGVRYERDGQTLTAPLDTVARLVFSPVPLDNAEPKGSGILLATGDFIEGDVTDIATQPVDWPRPPQLKAGVRSVLFGARTFETAREILCVDYAAVAPTPAAYELRTADGSLLRAKQVTITKDAVTVDGAPVKNVAEIRRL
jgi:hypothetical protein